MGKNREIPYYKNSKIQLATVYILCLIFMLCLFHMGGIRMKWIESDFNIAIISAIVGAILSYIFTHLLNKRAMQIEMKWVIYNDMVGDLYQSRYIAHEYVMELSKLLDIYHAAKIQSMDTHLEKVQCTINLNELELLIRKFLERRNHFLMYSKMYQVKYRWQILRKRNKDFVNYLKDCNDIFHEDWMYLQNCYEDLLEIRKKAINGDLDLYTFANDSIYRITLFKGADIKVTDISEEPIMKYMRNSLKKYI